MEVVITLGVAVVVGALIVLPQVLSSGGSNDVVRTQALPTTSTSTPTTIAGATATANSGDASGFEAPPTSTPPETTPTTAPSPPSTAAGSGATTATTVKHSTTTTTMQHSTTTAPAPCHNSTEPRCGPFRWDTDPGGNTPMSVSVSSSSDDIHTGQPVSFHVDASDPDAPVDSLRDCAVSYGDRGNGPCSGQPSCSSTQYGPWSPPPRQAGSYTGDVTHTYSEPGFYTVTVYLNRDGVCGHQPYRSQGSASVSITVSP